MQPTSTPLSPGFADVLRSLMARGAPSSVDIRPVPSAGGGVGDVLHLQPDGSDSPYRRCVAAKYVLAGGLLFRLASRCLERSYHLSNRGEIGSAERRPRKDLDHLVALLL